MSNYSNGNGHYSNGNGAAIKRAQGDDFSPKMQGIEKLVNLEAERMVLGSCLIDPDGVATVRAIIKPGDFYTEDHRVTFAAMCELNEAAEPCDDLTIIADHMERTGRGGVTGGVYSFLTDLMGRTPTAMYADYYANIVAQYSKRRQIVAAAQKMVSLAYIVDPDDPDATQAVIEAERVLSGVSMSTTRDDSVHLSETVGMVVDDTGIIARTSPEDMHRRFCRTGFRDIDRMLSGGLYRGTLTIVAGRPSMGKSGLGLCMARNAAHHGANVLVFSLEMSSHELTNRLLSMESGIESSLIRTGTLTDEQWITFMDAANVLSQTTIWLNDTPAMTISDLRAHARRHAALHGLDMIVIDYLQYLSAGGRNSGSDSNRQQEISLISRSLKALARELDIPIVALSQLSRAVEQRADKHPMLSDLRESGSLEQDADVVALIYRDEYYNPDSEQKNVAEVIIAKHRAGGIGTIPLYFRKELTEFRDLANLEEPVGGFSRPPVW